MEEFSPDLLYGLLIVPKEFTIFLSFIGVICKNKCLLQNNFYN